jgi:hypothetical protein
MLRKVTLLVFLLAVFIVFVFPGQSKEAGGKRNL